MSSSCPGGCVGRSIIWLIQTYQCMYEVKRHTTNSKTKLMHSPYTRTSFVLTSTVGWHRCCCDVLCINTKHESNQHAQLRHAESYHTKEERQAWWDCDVAEEESGIKLIFVGVAVRTRNTLERNHNNIRWIVSYWHCRSCRVEWSGQTRRAALCKLYPDFTKLPQSTLWEAKWRRMRVRFSGKDATQQIELCITFRTPTRDTERD